MLKRPLYFVHSLRVSLSGASHHNDCEEMATVPHLDLTPRTHLIERCAESVVICVFCQCMALCPHITVCLLCVHSDTVDDDDEDELVHFCGDAFAVDSGRCCI